MPDGMNGGSLWQVIGFGAVADLGFAVIAAVALWTALRLGDWAYKRGTSKPGDTLLGRWAITRGLIEDGPISAAIFHAARIIALAILFGLLLG